MTKFEEELYNKVKVTNIELTTEAEYKKSTLINHFKNWHSDEELQELSEKLDDTVDALDIARNSRDEFEREYKKLQSQLQQQALPVVPECVAKDIEKLKSFNKDGKNFHVFDLSYYSEESVNWVEYDYDNYVKFYLAVATGKYEVEKPQLFYLKNKLTGAYLYYDEATKLYSDIVGNVEDFFGTKTKFTQQEINSMQTGSYEQIEVEK